MEIVSAKFPFDVIINNDNWKAQSEDIQAVLLSVADVFIRHFPENQFPAVKVYQENNGPPLIIFEPTEEGELQIWLSTSGTSWSQYAYQFGHELCHVPVNMGGTTGKNAWFSEVLCETASMYVLKTISKSWREFAPVDGFPARFHEEYYQK